MKKYFLQTLVFLVMGASGLFGKEFKWAADLASGVPSVFYSQTEPGKVIGFEKEVADAIAEEMGRESVFVNNEWDGLIPGLNRGMYDAIINTLVVTEERKKVVDFSEEYMVTSEQLIVNVQEERVQSIDDLKPGDVVGTLKASKAADIFLGREGLDVRLYATELNFFEDLGNGRLRAAMIDAPIALYYAGIDPKLKLVGGPVDRIEFAVAVRKGETEFLEEINGAIRRLKANGKLRNILERWNLWSELSAENFGDFSESEQEPVMFNAFMEYHKGAKGSGFMAEVKKYWNFLPMLGKGAIITVQLSVSAMLLAIGLGFLLAIMRLYGPKPLALISKCYIEIVRGTPLLIQLYFIFYGLPSIGIKFEPFMAGMIALGLNYAAYEAENYRAGLISIPHSQMEAARALGMTHWQALLYVVVPQAFRVMLPPVTNDFISLLKDSSLVSVITIVELTFAYNLLATTYYNYFGIGILVAVIYLLLGLPFVKLSRWAERRLSAGKKGGKLGPV